MLLSHSGFTMNGSVSRFRFLTTCNYAWRFVRFPSRFVPPLPLLSLSPPRSCDPWQTQRTFWALGPSPSGLSAFSRFTRLRGWGPSFPCLPLFSTRPGSLRSQILRWRGTGLRYASSFLRPGKPRMGVSGPPSVGPSLGLARFFWPGSSGRGPRGGHWSRGSRFSRPCRGGTGLLSRLLRPRPVCF